MWPGFNSRTRRHMWVEFVVGSRPSSERFFSGYSGFPLSSKPTFLNSNLIWKVSPVAKNTVIYFLAISGYQSIQTAYTGLTLRDAACFTTV